MKSLKTQYMKTITSLILMLAFSTMLFAQEKKAFSLTKGTTLTYEVEQGDKSYQFIMKITELGKSVSFNWQMAAPINKSGSVTMTADAMNNATALFNYFSGGQTTLDDQTSTFISRDAYKKIVSNGTVMLASGGANDTPESFDVLQGNHSDKNGSYYLTMSRPVNDENYIFDDYILENSDGSKVIRVWKNAEFPLIIFMETNFKIYLVSVEQ